MLIISTIGKKNTYNKYILCNEWAIDNDKDDSHRHRQTHNNICLVYANMSIETEEKIEH